MEVVRGNHMEQRYKKFTRPSDPRISIELPKVMYQDLKNMANANVRRLSDEIVARLVATLEECQQFNSHREWAKLLYEQTSKYNG